MVTFIRQCFDNILNRYSVRHVNRVDNSIQFPLHIKKKLKNKVATSRYKLSLSQMSGIMSYCIPASIFWWSEKGVNQLVSNCNCLSSCLFACLFANPFKFFHMISGKVFYFHQSHFPGAILLPVPGFIWKCTSMPSRSRSWSRSTERSWPKIVFLASWLFYKKHRYQTYNVNCMWCILSCHTHSTDLLNLKVIILNEICMTVNLSAMRRVLMTSSLELVSESSQAWSFITHACKWHSAKVKVKEKRVLSVTVFIFPID